MYPQLVQQFLQQERLPLSYGEDALHYFVPLAEELARELQSKGPAPFFLGVNGAQGTGKTTLAKLLCSLLKARDHSVVNLSIDDFYFSKEARNALANTVHPLLKTRGVPGTHDTRLLEQTLKSLANAEPDTVTRLPCFDKSVDDVVPPERWLEFTGKPDLIVLEGWCVGVTAQAASELAQPVNALEAQEDQDGQWRRYVNDALRSHYQNTFEQLDKIIMLQAPSFEQVHLWRGLQEEKLRDKADIKASGVMNAEQLVRFIQHYERLTRHCLQTLPQRADTVFLLKEDHSIESRRNRPPG